MLKIPADKFANAVEALMIAAVSATDQSGLRVRADVPRLPAGVTPPNLQPVAAGSDPIRDFRDWDRIKAITLGALVAMLNGPAHVDDERHFSSLDRARKGSTY